MEDVQLGDRFVRLATGSVYEAVAWEGLGRVVMQCGTSKRRVQVEQLEAGRGWSRAVG